MWFLVKYEDDESMRVLGQDEIRHIFEGEDEDEIEAGDIVSAIWVPNGHYYDAKVLQKGSEFHFFSTNLPVEPARERFPCSPIHCYACITVVLTLFKNE